VLLSPRNPDARDEGPRLIPLDEPRTSERARLDHYLSLADKMLSKSKAKTTP